MGNSMDEFVAGAIRLRAQDDSKGRFRFDNPQGDDKKRDQPERSCGIARPSQSIEELQQEIAQWANDVFPHRTAHDALCKLMLEEIPEFALAQKDPGEYADLVILILDIAYLNKINVAEAVRDKMEINRNREWIVDEDNQMHHIKESGRPPGRSKPHLSMPMLERVDQPVGNGGQKISVEQVGCGITDTGMVYRCYRCDHETAEPSDSCEQCGALFARTAP